MKKLAYQKIIPLLAALALLGGCASSPSGGSALDAALLRAVKRNNADKARQLLEAGANPNAQNYKDRTALMIAAYNGDAEIARMLLDAGANPNIQSPDGATALMFADQDGHTEAVKLLLEAGANPNIQRQDGVTALMLAAKDGHAEAVKLLLEAGADPNIQRPDGLTALRVATEEGRAEVVKLLLEAGANPDIQLQDGSTALMFAADRGYTDIAKMLLEAWADPDIQRQDGITALMFAAQNGHMEVVKLLLEAGADPSIQVTKGVLVLTARGYANLNGHSEIEQLLSTTTVKRTELAWQIIAKKYPSLAAEFPTASDYEAWRKRCNGKRFTRSLISPIYSGVEYGEGDMFIVEKYGLEIKDMQFTAVGGFAYLVGGLGHISGHSQLCYLISVTQIPYLTAQGRSMITKPLLLEYIGEEQYREGYQVKTCDVFLAFAEGSSEYKDYQNMMIDLQRIEQNPSGYAYILDE